MKSLGAAVVAVGALALFLVSALSQTPESPYGNLDNRGKGEDRRPPGGPPLLPPFARERLKLTEDQDRQFRELQKEVHLKLMKILTEDQRKQLHATRPTRPGDRPGGPPERREGEGPAHVLPPFARERLKLTEEQQTQLAEVEKDAGGRLQKILTEEQQKQLKEMRPPRPGDRTGDRKEGPPPKARLGERGRDGLQVVPPFVRERVELTGNQEKQLADLEKEVQGKLQKILTAEQWKRLNEFRPPPPPPPGDRPPEVRSEDRPEPPDGP